LTKRLYLALVADTYTPDRDAHGFWNDVVANGIAGGNGYTTPLLQRPTGARSTVPLDIAVVVLNEPLARRSIVSLHRDERRGR
jgi:hypothetical protein